MSTTDEGSQDLENTPRPKKSLRSDLGYSSRSQSDEGQSDTHMPQQQSAVKPKRAGSALWYRESYWDSDSEEDAKQMKQGKRLVAFAQRAKIIEAQEIRAKELPEAIATLFECGSDKAKAIDRRLRRLGPGAQRTEGPAALAHELSGIPVDIYQGIASGSLIATVPPNEVRDMGTNPEVFAVDMATDTTDLPIARVAGQDMATDTTGLPAEEVTTSDMTTNTADLPVQEVTTSHMATDTTDLPVQEVTTSHMATDTTDLRGEAISTSNNRFSRQALFHYLPMLMTILFGLYMLFSLYMWLSPELKNGLQYKNIFPHRHTPLPAPSHYPQYHSTPIVLVYPPTPASQLGLVGMMTGSTLGGVLGGSKW